MILNMNNSKKVPYNAHICTLTRYLYTYIYPLSTYTYTHCNHTLIQTPQTKTLKMNSGSGITFDPRQSPKINPDPRPDSQNEFQPKTRLQNLIQTSDRRHVLFKTPD